MPRRVFFVVAVFSALTVAAASPAVAAPEPILTYQGTVTVNTSEGDTYVLATTLTVDCTNDPCTAITSSSDGTYTPALTNDQQLALTDGALSVNLPEYGDLCTLHWIGAGVLQITIGDSGAAISRGSAAGAPRSCEGGATAEAASASIAGTLAYQSGSICLLDGTCPEPSPTATVAPTSAGEEPTIGELIAWPVEPSTLSTLATVDQSLGAASIAWAAGGALVLVLLISFPSVLLDSATDRVSSWFDERRLRRSGAVRASSAAPPLTVLGWPFAVVGLMAAAFASAYVDPDFGFDTVGVRTIVSVLASYIVAIALGWAFVALVMRVAFPRSRPRVEFRPLTLLIVAAAVVFSRLTGFEPGIIFGLVAGVGFATVLAAGRRAFAAGLGILYLFAVSAGGWLGYSALLDYVGQDPTWGQLLALECLSAVAITGASALPIALLPVRGLTGHVLWQWNKWIWALAYLVAAAGFLLVLMPLPDSWQQVGAPLLAWAGGYVAYCAVAVLVWLVVMRPWRRTTEEPA